MQFSILVKYYLYDYTLYYCISIRNSNYYGYLYSFKNDSCNARFHVSIVDIIAIDIKYKHITTYVYCLRSENMNHGCSYFICRNESMLLFYDRINRKCNNSLCKIQFMTTFSAASMTTIRKVRFLTIFMNRWERIHSNINVSHCIIFALK